MDVTSLLIPLLLTAVAAWGLRQRVDVYAALTDGEHTWVRRLELGTGRGRIRVMAAHHAFDLLRRYLTQLPITEETEGE